MESLDFTESLSLEIQNALKEVKSRRGGVQEMISKNIVQHKIELRREIMQIRETLRAEFDDFFNGLLGSIRADWNLFNLQENMIKET